MACKVLAVRFIFCAIASVVAVPATNYPLTTSASPTFQPLKVGFILAGSTADLDWNYAHDQGRKYLEKVLKFKVQTTVAERVPENAEAERVMEKMILQGTKLIFSTGFGFLEPALRVAARHPEVIVMQCERSCPESAKNVGSYFAVDYAPLYVAGIGDPCMLKLLNRLQMVAGRRQTPCIQSNPVTLILLLLAELFLQMLGKRLLLL